MSVDCIDPLFEFVVTSLELDAEADQQNNEIGSFCGDYGKTVQHAHQFALRRDRSVGDAADQRFEKLVLNLIQERQREFRLVAEIRFQNVGFNPGSDRDAV